MVEVRLHGALAAKFGRVFCFDITSPAEAVPAIEAGRPGFRKAIMDLAGQGMVFRVRTRDHDYDDDDVSTSLGSAKRVDIIPIVRGASRGVRFVVGAVLTVAGFFVSGIPGFQVVGYSMMSAGISLMLGSVVEWLTPVQKKDDPQKNAQSWTFNGPANTVDQGVPVPVIYGEVLTGSHAISAGISAAQVNASGALDASVEIGGRLDVAQITQMVGTFTNIFDLSGSPFNLNEPYTYAWSKTGFAGVTTRLVNVSSPTARLEVDHVVGGFGTFEVTGTVTLSLTGKDPNDGSTVTVSQTVNIRSSVTAQEVQYGGIG
jgi:predicted phage tail protein